MKSWLENQSPEAREKITQGFVVLHTLDRLQNREKAETAPVGYADLYSLVCGTPLRPVAEIQRAMLQKANLIRDFQAMLKRHSKSYGPRAAAASTHDVQERTGEGFTLTLKPSRADETQVYVQLKLGPKVDTPRYLVVSQSGEEGFIMHELPMASDGLFQWLENRSSELVRALQNREAELYLC